MSNEVFRKCKECDETKPIESFVTSKGSAGGYRWTCRECWNALARQRHKTNVNKDGWKELQAQQRELLAKRRDEEASARRSALLETQGGACAVCLRVALVSSFMHLDATGSDWHGLLCSQCRMALLGVGHDLSTALLLVAYLERRSTPIEITDTPIEGDWYGVI